VAGQTIAFGTFRLLPDQQLLLEDDRPVAIGARALGILIALVRRAGEVVSRAELIAQVWPDTFVEESNLRVHVSNLRRVLRDGEAGRRFIINVPGRGYSFVGQSQAQQGAWTDKEVAVNDRPSLLPARLTRVIGRTGVIKAISTSLAQRRLVTLVGPGGMGKTTVALAVARAVSESFRDGAAFVDLAAINHPSLVAGALAGALGLAIPSEDALPVVIDFLRQKAMLLVLDNCEHVVEAAAAAAEEVSSAAPGVHVLATSREPLRAAGERVHRLPPLESPSAAAELTAAEAMTFPGIELFVERAASSLDGFELTDANAKAVADICRRLDGIALAIEFAASRVSAFGVADLAGHLDDRFRLLTSGRRTALPRQQTLTATLDWSYQLLPETGRMLLRRLCVFVGEFALEAAVAVMGDREPSQTLVELADLVAKSLVVADHGSGIVRYRLLETTRLYGLEKLREHDELQQARRRHATYMHVLLAPADLECETLPPEDWLARYGSQSDNVRAALDWASDAGTDRDTVIALTVAAVPLWVQLSLINVCRTRVEHALALLTGDTEASMRQRMQLSAALGWSMMFGSGRAASAGAAWTTTLQLAERLGDRSYQLRGLWGILVDRLNKGDFRAALDLAHRIHGIASEQPDAVDLMMADRLMATTLHYRGEQDSARLHIDRMLDRYFRQENRPRVARFQVDQGVTAHYFQARIMWLQGDVDQALHAIEANLVESAALGHALSFGSVLGQGACPIALFTADLPAARRYCAMLLAHAERHGLRLWRRWASCFDGVIMAKAGELERGLQVMRAAFEQAGENQLLPRFMILRAEFASCLAAAGDIALGLATIDALYAQCEQSEEGWFVPELLRIKGELVASGGARDAAARSVPFFQQAIDLARRQGARSWALRSAISLARLKLGPRRWSQARTQLADILASFTEGFATADLRAAQSLLGNDA
jgi:predicted ATPase/DNA-binding winged helix-turn-helix (wHTH) protein